MSYDIYRSSIETGEYTKINTSDVTAMEYTDTGLKADTTYWYKIQALDQNANSSSFSPAVSATIPITLLAFAADYPQAGTTSTSSVEIKVKTNENGHAYFVCLPSGAAVPSSAQVKAGQDSTGMSIELNLKGSSVLTADTETTLSATGLTGNTDYNIYVVGEDSLGNLQATPVEVAVKTMMSDSQAVALDKASLAITYAQGDSRDSVTQNVILPSSGANGTTISWSSDNTAISSSGIVTRPSDTQGDAVGTLTATVSKNDFSDTVTFSLIIKTATVADVDECFIATAAFGSKNQTDVVLLRQFRDRFLLTKILWVNCLLKLTTIIPADR